MYVPRHFAMDEPDVLDLLHGLGAADLVTPTTEGLVSTFLPLLFEESAGEHGTLLGHVARMNDHWSRTVTGPSLVIVHGSDSYISPTWYAAKAEHGRVVPTWNHLTLNIVADLVVHDDTEWVRDLVTRMTAKYEEPFDPQWSPADAPPAYIEGQLRAIVGFELRITAIEAKAKFNQNRSAADRSGVLEGLRAVGDVDGVSDLARFNA
ncbi:MAG: FMN-binding negative transcriptional regulator [Nostocoides sp.]